MRNFTKIHKAGGAIGQHHLSDAPTKLKATESIACESNYAGWRINNKAGVGYIFIG